MIGHGGRSRTILCLSLALIAPQRSAVAQVALPCAYDDVACAHKVARRHPAATLGFWEEALTRPLEQRIGAPPPEVMEFLHLGVILNKDDYRPRPAPPDPDFLKDVRDAIAELPREIKGPLVSKLAGIFLVEDIVGSAWADQIFDAKRRPVAGMLALNQAVLKNYTANAWATWKENTPFAARDGS
jgi:hypothetical protein